MGCIFPIYRSSSFIFILRCGKDTECVQNTKVTRVKERGKNGNLLLWNPHLNRNLSSEGVYLKKSCLKQKTGKDCLALSWRPDSLFNRQNVLTGEKFPLMRGVISKLANRSEVVLLTHHSEWHILSSGARCIVRFAATSPPWIYDLQPFDIKCTSCEFIIFYR